MEDDKNERENRRRRLNLKPGAMGRGYIVAVLAGFAALQWVISSVAHAHSAYAAFGAFLYAAFVFLRLLAFLWIADFLERRLVSVALYLSISIVAAALWFIGPIVYQHVTILRVGSSVMNAGYDM